MYLVTFCAELATLAGYNFITNKVATLKLISNGDMFIICSVVIYLLFKHHVYVILISRTFKTYMLNSLYMVSATKFIILILLICFISENIFVLSFT